jgi:two-component system sensor histidine kinase YesM
MRIRQRIAGRFHSITAQLFVFFFLGMVVPVLVGGMLSYEKSKQIIEEQVSGVASTTVLQVRDKLNLLFRRIDDTSMTLLGNSTIQDTLKGRDPEGALSENELYKKAQKLLSDVMNYELFDIYIFDVHKKNNILTSDYSVTTDPWETEWFRRIKEANGRPVWFGLTDVSFLSSRNVALGYPVFGLGRAIRDLETGELLGVMLIEIRGDLLTKELNSLHFGKSGFVFLVDAAGRYMYYPDHQFYGKPSTYETMSAQETRRKNIELLQETLDNGWIVCGVVPMQEMIRDSAAIRNLTLWILLGSITLAAVLGCFVSRKIGRPLIRLSKLMKRGEEGDLSVRFEVVGRDEIGQLGRSFNKMVRRIGQLIRQIEEEEAQKKKAEIRALRYQINPHFLYNTLNSIRWMAKLDGSDKVADAISALVSLLEASLQRNGSYARLGDELELIRKYMQIQQFRYDNEIRLDIRCPESFRHLEIPRMLLQPIVENAIFHGIAPKEEEGCIEIRVDGHGSDVVISIRDNGVGMDEDRLNRLWRAESETSSGGMTHIGIRHVHQTLQLHYGSRCGVRIESAEGAGTTVYLYLSKAREARHVSGYAG